MKYGLYDTQENCWLGNPQGPLLYEDEMLAKIAARIFDVRLEQAAGRTRAIPYIEGNLTLKDEKKAAMSAEEALEKLEKGLVL